MKNEVDININERRKIKIFLIRDDEYGSGQTRPDP